MNKSSLKPRATRSEINSHIKKLKKGVDTRTSKQLEDSEDQEPKK